jgi:G:T/U-mismatch repair DNA glycosylase
LLIACSSPVHRPLFSQNPFWNIAGIALGFRRELNSYDDKKTIVTLAGYALWDVLQAVEKKKGSSLDKDIKEVRAGRSESSTTALF